jgi:hypothetical protein
MFIRASWSGTTHCARGIHSIGKWIDSDGDNKFDTLEVETRYFNGPRTFDNSGTPLHADNQTIVKERIYRDKADPDLMHNEMTTIDNASRQNQTGARRAAIVASIYLRALALMVDKTRKLLDARSQFLLREAKLIELLQIEPVFRARAKPMAETECRIGGHAAFAIHDLGDAIDRHLNLAGQFGCADLEVIEFFSEMFAGMDGSASH